MAGESGVTLVETAVTTLIAGAIFLGLAVAYLFGVDAWEKTAWRISMQQAGTQILAEFNKRVQPARSWTVHGDNAVVLNYAADSSLEFAVRENMVFRDQHAVVERLAADSLAIQPVDRYPIFRQGELSNLIEVRFAVVSTRQEFAEGIRFSTQICRRNGQ